MKTPREFIEAEVVFLSVGEGGRTTPLPITAYGGQYRPHIVLQSRDVREAKFEIRGGQQWSIEDYLGIAFWTGPSPVPVGQSLSVVIALMFAPDPAYDSVQAGAEFTIREGGKIVGHGKVLRRWTADT